MRDDNRLPYVVSTPSGFIKKGVVATTPEEAIQLTFPDATRVEATPMLSKEDYLSLYTEYRQRAELGRYWLNTYVPDWRDRVLPEKLYMGGGNECALALAFDTSYDNAVEDANLDNNEEIGYGFYIPQDELDYHYIVELDDDPCYAILTVVWQDLIKEGV